MDPLPPQSQNPPRYSNASIIPARHSSHTHLTTNQTLQIINPSGHQVADIWIFALPTSPSTPPTWLSTAQTRQKLGKLGPEVGDILVDTQRNPLVKIVKDTSAGVHDLLYPACDGWRYDEAGLEGHESCAGNLRRELTAIVKGLGGSFDARDNGLVELERIIRMWGWTPEPLNVFMNVVTGGERKGRIAVKKPEGKAGDYLVLRAEVDCVVVISACPNDLQDTNGGITGEIAYRVLDDGEELAD